MSALLSTCGQAFKIRLNNAEQMPLVSSCLLDICLQGLSPRATDHWHLGECVRDTFHLVQQTHHFILFHCLTPGSSRLRALARLTPAFSSFAMSAGFPDAAEGCWSKLLRYRLDNGPDLSWETFGPRLMVNLKSSSGPMPRNEVDFLAIVRALQEEVWEDDGISLRVGTLSLSLPNSTDELTKG